MGNEQRNYYGSLCTEMYEILHKAAPKEELDFYLSYAQKGQKILEPLCGSGRFLIPFLERGFDIRGMDLSHEMLAKLKEKMPGAHVDEADLIRYAPGEVFDYIFIPSGSISLFTDMALCQKVLARLRELLAPGGKLVFAAEAMAARCSDDEAYRETAAVQTAEGLTLRLKTKNRYEPESQIQFSPGIYELYQGEALLQQEKMDFQTRLYRFGEMEAYLKEAGFTTVKTYSSFQKTPAKDDQSDFFLYECGIEPDGR